MKRVGDRIKAEGFIQQLDVRVLAVIDRPGLSKQKARGHLSERVEKERKGEEGSYHAACLPRHILRLRGGSHEAQDVRVGYSFRRQAYIDVRNRSTFHFQFL